MALASKRFGGDPRLRQASENNPPMKQGERGEAVATVQRALVDLGFKMPVTTAGGMRLPDGIFGPETASVVRQFQAQQLLSVDGIVGRQTLHKLEELITAMIAFEKAKFVASSNMPPGMANSHHSTLQRG